MFPVEPDISSRHPVAALQDCDDLSPPSPIYSPSIEIRRAAYQISIQDFSTLKKQEIKERCCAPDESDTTPPLRGCRVYVRMQTSFYIRRPNTLTRLQRRTAFSSRTPQAKRACDCPRTEGFGWKAPQQGRSSDNGKLCSPHYSAWRRSRT